MAITKLTSSAGEVTIQGNSYGKPATAEFVIQLKRLPYIQNVKVDYINESIKDYSADDTFQMTLTLLYHDPKQSDSDDSEATEPVAEESPLPENSGEAAEIPVSEDSETAETGVNEEGNVAEGSVEIDETSEDGGARPVEGGVE